MSTQIERLAQVNSTNLGVGREAFRDSLPKDLAFLDDVGAIRDLQCFSDVVIGDQDADAFRAKLRDDSLDFEHGDWIDSCKRLIQQDECRVDREAPGDLDAAALSPR